MEFPELPLADTFLLRALPLYLRPQPLPLRPAAPSHGYAHAPCASPNTNCDQIKPDCEAVPGRELRPLGCRSSECLPSAADARRKFLGCWNSHELHMSGVPRAEPRRLGLGRLS